MTDQLNREIEQSNFSNFETAVEALPESRETHRIRQILARGAIVACGVLGAAGSLFALQPSGEKIIGPVTIEAGVSYSPKVEVLGLEAADSKYGIGMDVDIKAPDLDKLEEVSNRLTPLVSKITEKENSQTVLQLVQTEYTPEINEMKRELILKSALALGVGALAGSLISAKALEKISTKQHNWRVVLGATAAGLMLVGGAEYQSLGNLQNEQMTEQLGQELRQPFDQYLLTSTSKMLVNLDSINQETQKQISRIVNIVSTLEKTPTITSEEAQTWVVYSDAHDLPTVPGSLQAIARSSNADAIIGLGDYGNKGEEFEMELMDGLSFESTSFIGYDDITSCKTWNQIHTECVAPGNPIPHGALSDNHDPKSIKNTFESLGMVKLDNKSSFQEIPIYGLSGACFVESDNCRGDNAKKMNQDYAIRQLELLKSSERTIPSIGFFASYDAAEIFEGTIDTLIVGGKHEFKVEMRKGSKIIYLDAVSQGFPRGAKEAGALIIKVTTEGKLLECSNIQWQSLQQSNLAINPC